MPAYNACLGIRNVRASILRKILRISLVLGVIVALFLIVGLLAAYLALRHEPRWYAEAVATADHKAEEKASGRMLQRAADLTSALETKCGWKIAFTAEEINGWLAVDVPENHPDLLPKSLGHPRVVIEPDGVTLACRASHSGITTVVSLKVDVYLAEENLIAIRIRKARAGSLPWPLGKVVDGFTSSAARSDVRLSWRQIDGDPLALIKIPKTQGPGHRQIRVTTLRLDEGKIIVGGSTSAKKQ